MTKYPSGYNAASKTGHPIPCENMQVLRTSSLTVVFAVLLVSLDLEQPVSRAKDCASSSGVDICEWIF